MYREYLFNKIFSRTLTNYQITYSSRSLVFILLIKPEILDLNCQVAFSYKENTCNVTAQSVQVLIEFKDKIELAIKIVSFVTSFIKFSCQEFFFRRTKREFIK